MYYLYKFLTGMFLLSALIPVYAGEGFYVGVSTGRADHDISLADLSFVDDGSFNGTSLDNSDNSIAFYLGYQHTKNVSIEIGFIDLGKFELTAVSDGSGTPNQLGYVYFPGSIRFLDETSGITYAIKIQAPVSEQFMLYGKLGYFNWNSDISLVANNFVLLGASADGSDPFYGFGGSFNIDGKILLNIEYSMFSLDDLDLDVDVISVGAQFIF